MSTRGERVQSLRGRTPPHSLTFIILEKGEEANEHERLEVVERIHRVLKAWVKQQGREGEKPASGHLDVSSEH